MLRLVGHVGPKVTAHHAVPRGVVLPQPWAWATHRSESRFTAEPLTQIDYRHFPKHINLKNWLVSTNTFWERQVVTACGWIYLAVILSCLRVGTQLKGGKMVQPWLRAARFTMDRPTRNGNAKANLHEQTHIARCIMVPLVLGWPSTLDR